MKSKLVALIAAIAIFATACAGDAALGNADTDEPEEENTTVTEEAPPNTTGDLTPAQGVLPEGPSALDNMEHRDFPEPLVPVSEILSGGPPPDGIPAIDDPKFLDVIDNLDLLPPEEPVVFVEIEGEARAYPVRALIWHEIVNDVIAGVPVAVTYCPLCNSAVSYVREVRGVETTFGTSGRLFASALVMYDRATESLWTHFDGRAVVGVLTGEELETVPSALISWGDFRSTYPTGKVLDWNQTGFRRDYGINPYTGYDDPGTQPFLFRGAVDDRALAKQRVVGVATDDAATAYALELISGGEAKATHSTVGTQDIVIFWKAGQSTALERASLSAGRDVGSVGVFDPFVDGQRLTFTAVGEDFVDEETGSVWLITGEAVDGPLAGSRLERIQHLDTFWFAWATYQPGTTLVEQ